MTIRKEELESFLADNHDAVLSTTRSNGATQLSVVTVGFHKGGAIFTTTKSRAKFINLNKNQNCSLLISSSDWKPYVVLEGKASIFSDDRTNPDTLKKVLRIAYRSAAGKEHPDWDEYDAAMKRDSRVAIIVNPKNIYGTI
ncbi:pyridoxamine 5'-phosphate oxidase family protein [Chloroflexi bacterium]|nr:pyridoxamine 5'-phosphate oxidase family protein [Chloroflexota bacterium]